ncbi:Glyceraldehyde 3-phosphate phosphatase [uncultured archaeon]|nr:Glyceraldehyde 3-phosphate phosphatase [uncultured archaeon]
MKAVLFDLDYTLCDADQYYLGAFRDVSNYIQEKHGLSNEEIYKFLVNRWREKTTSYSHLFDDLLEHLNLHNENVQTIIKIFNSHELDSEFELYPDVIPTLRKLRSQGYKLGIVTDGNVERQMRKIQKLELEKLIDNVTYTKNTEPKPSSIPFETALGVIKIKPSSAIYVADNPFVDFKGAKTIGMKTARILRGMFADITLNEHVDFTIEKLDEILKILKT